MTTKIDRLPSEEQVDLAVETLRLLTDATRLRIIWALLHGEHSVGDLADHVGASPTNVSQHLAKLRLARLVRTRRVGNRIYYRAGDAHVRRLVEEALFHTGHLGQDPAHPVIDEHAGTEHHPAQPSRPA